jgi:hypothetical protein
MIRSTRFILYKSSLTVHPLVVKENRLLWLKRETAEQSECGARKHEEEEAGKASLLGFKASNSLCGF